MVKFSKELEAQLIPEWKEAFVNYWLLKKQIKKIKLSQKSKQPLQVLDHEFGLSIFYPIRSLATNISNKLFHSDSKTEIIQVRSKSMEDGDEEVYQTELVQLFSEEDEVTVFFESLDGELNKVNQFYKNKESEFLERGEILSKQLGILLDLKRVLNEHRRKPNAGVLSPSWSSSPARSSLCSESSANETSTDSQIDEIIAALEKKGIGFISSGTRKKPKKGKPRMAVRMDVPATTPARTITAVTSMLWEDLVKNPKKESAGDFISRKKIQCAEKMIRGAFVELYRGLGLLKTYSSLNIVAFTKILKKFDKVTVFFGSLDGELNKVNQFYKNKESEFLERGEILSKQLGILLDLKRVLNEHRRKLNAGVLSPWSSSPARSSLCSESSANETSTDSQIDEIIAALEKKGIGFISSGTRKKPKKGKPRMAVRMDVPATTPARTITAVTSMLWEDLVKNPKKESAGDFISRKKIQCAEKMIRGAFVELYRGLGLLKTYSSLNIVAFTKILKKFDKVSNQQASASYLKVVKRSHFISSDKVVRLMDEVESIFTKHFANNDRKKAMKFLRPQQQKESHMVTFFVGLLTGCFVSLFSVYAILAHLAGIFKPNSEISYVEIVYPVFSVFTLLSLHLFTYGCNLFMWKATRINCNFIFEFQPSTAIKYRDAFLICTTLMTSVVAAMVIHLLLRASGFSPNHVDVIPGILLVIFIFVLVCPFDIFYRPTRYCFIRIIRNILCSPFYKVLMVDFFMADQLTSQIPLLRHMESTTCYFLAGSFKTHRNETCKSGRVYRELAYIISFLPYYWRAMQCARRWFDETDLNHLANMGKYVSAMVAAGARITYGRQENHLWFCIVLITSVVATVYQLYWDFVKDWGLLNSKSKNLWLRDDLILKNKSIYYMSIVLNIVLRVAWVETVMGFRFNMIESRMLDFLLASLEVIRRGHWNFYRLENEHLNNVGKFRAVKAVPLPFREIDSDG